MPTPLEKLKQESESLARYGFATPEQRLSAEAANLARTGSATPQLIPSPTGPIGNAANGPSAGSGFGTDTTGRIFRYNPDGSVNTGATPAAPVTPASVSPMTPASSQAAADAKYAYEHGLDSYQPGVASKPINEEAVRQELFNSQQRRIDAINTLYAGKINASVVGEQANNTGATRAISARGGLMGSDFGKAQADRTTQANQRITDAIEAERGLAIKEVYDKVDRDAKEKVAALKAEAVGNATAYKEYLEKSQATALESAKTIGASGLSAEEFKAKNPKGYQDLLNNSGLSELDFTLRVDAAKPKAEQIDWKSDVQGGNIIVYGLNKNTGQIEYHTQELPKEVKEAAGNDIKIIEGEIWSVTPDGKSASKIGGQREPLIETVGSGKTSRKIVSFDNGVTWKDALSGTPTTKPTPVVPRTSPAPTNVNTTQAVKEMTTELSKLTGTDGYIAPDTYTAARAAWVSKGLNPTDFDAKMKGYRNPNNPNYVTVKQ